MTNGLTIGERLSLAWKVLKGYRHSGIGGGTRGSSGSWIERWNLPGSERDWVKLAGHLWLNSAVAACVGWATDTFPEAPMQVKRKTKDGKGQVVPDHPLALLMDDPTEDWSGEDFWGATLASTMSAGRSFGLKDRDRAGDVTALHWKPWWMLKPCWDKEGRQFISHYEYFVNGSWEEVPKRDVVHFRRAVNLANPREGWTPLIAGLREIVSDNASLIYTAALLLEMGVIPYTVTPKDPTAGFGGPDNIKAIKKKLKVASTGDNAGSFALLDGAIEINKLGLSPEEMALDKLPARAEARICALLRISPMVVGLNVGDAQRTYSNMGEAREAAYESFMMPVKRLLAAQLRKQMMQDLLRDPQLYIDWDYSAVRVLQPDMDKTFDRYTRAIQRPWVSANEGRLAVGLPALPGLDEVYEKPEPTLIDPASDKPKPGNKKDEADDLQELTPWASRVLGEIEALAVA